MNKDLIFKNRSALTEKVKESVSSVLPIILIVAFLCMTVAPISSDLLLSFLIGAVMVVTGMGFFSLGAEMSMTPIGSKIGTDLTKTKNLPLILAVSFALGFAVTVAEPDLQVLAESVPHINNSVLLVTVGVGVGFFLSVCMLRMITGIRLRWLLIFFYIIVFVLAAFTDDNYLSIAFDSGGVTTGPMTVPFILAFGMGVSHIRSDRRAEADSFGLVSLCSIGPILAVLILGFFYPGKDTTVVLERASYATTRDIGVTYLEEIPKCLGEIALSLLPIAVIFLLFQLFSLHLGKRSIAKITVGILYTYIGLVLFLTGVNVGFASLGAVLGEELAEGGTKWLLIPLSMLLGWFVISAEPAVAVISLAMGISMLRVVTGISILWFLVPGYAAALIMSFFVPDIYTAIAFDSGGVASGPMTATFLLQFMIGASMALGGNALRDAFGVVATVAMMPLISIQAIGLIYKFKDKRGPASEPEEYGDLDIVEIWEAESI